jgi:hypothetical protein
MTDTQEKERTYLYLAGMLIVIPTGFGVWTIWGMLPAISAMLVAGGVLVFFRTILIIRFAELELHLKPVFEGNE